MVKIQIKYKNPFVQQHSTLCLIVLFCCEWPVLIRALHAYSNSCHLERGGDETTPVMRLLIMKATNSAGTKRM